MGKDVAGFEVMNYKKDSPITIIGLSGGKDSAATMILAINRKVPNLMACFYDTGNEHPITYEYIAYLKDKLHLALVITKADFSKQIAKKREFVIAKWKERGVSQVQIDLAIKNLIPTGNPFLDLCKWKGRFPSTKARFCTAELKIYPFEQQLLMPLLKDEQDVIMWTGVRADESRARANLPHTEWIDPGYTMHRPILNWNAKRTFDYATKNGVEHNPLYSKGMGRVGCMPCIMSRKNEIKEIANRFPDVIDKIELWEKEVGQTSKRGAGTFFPATSVPLDIEDDNPDLRASIRKTVQWSKTTYGGKQYDIFANEVPSCSSIYGLCE